ncbi:tetratricopeptide repeat protein [Seohaeicola zhoushanensis]|nr:tetratricopeptide repeat protein [Seohaeicola zhoushanensis]
MAGCVPDRIPEPKDGTFAPGVDHRKAAEDGLEVGNRLMAAGQHELALEAFTRAALTEGLTPEILTSMGTANLGLGRLGQAEQLLRRALKEDDTRPEAWNNLGVVLMERGEVKEAEQVFHRAYALDNGESDSIRDNLRLVQEKSANPDKSVAQTEAYKVVQRGNADFLIRKNP